MKVKIVVVVSIVCVVILLFLQQNLIRNRTIDISNEELLQSINARIDSLENYRDSLKIVIDTNKVKIIEVEKQYETIRDRIITQSVDSDCITFSNYVSNYQGLISNNNSSTAESN